ncbi:MAG TPA: NADH-quinone oxidoreductase subunit N [Candidatus Baltobacteraceae bacterium]
MLPLFIVGGTAVIILLADLLMRKANGWVSIALGLTGLIVAGIVAGTNYYGPPHNAFDGGFMQGGFAIVLQEVIVVAAIVSLALFHAGQRPERMGGAVALVLWATSGAMLMAGSANLMTVFLGLELLSLALYCLCALAERATSREAGLKYLILSSTASGFLLFGMAMLFGASGSVTIASLTNPALAGNALYWIGGGLFLVGLAFKLSLVPFHVWSPDVYEGAPLPITAYMSVVTKAGALAVFARFAYAIPASASHALLAPFFIIAGISMIAGNLGMLAQTDMKRLLAYSGIAQIGYIVAALAGSTALGVRYAIYYLIAYMFMNLGAFAVVALCSPAGDEAGSCIESFHGLALRRPVLAAVMTFFLLALAGFPPTAGFLGKILILSTNVNAGFPWLAALLIAGTAISLYAYFKVIRVMYDRHAKAQERATAPLPLAWVSMAICVALVVVMTFYPFTPSNVLPLVK